MIKNQIRVLRRHSHSPGRSKTIATTRTILRFIIIIMIMMMMMMIVITVIIVQ